MKKLQVLAISGSLRKKSFNTALLHEAAKRHPEGMEISIHDISDIPLYNRDVEEGGFPESVARLKKAIQNADGILFATPEYNHAMSGVLKNAIDWVSRGENEFNDKPAAICGVSDGLVGTARAQINLRITINTLNMHAMSKPLMQVPNGDKKFSTTGELTDEKTQVKLTEFLEAFSAWIIRLTP